MTWALESLNPMGATARHFKLTILLNFFSNFSLFLIPSSPTPFIDRNREKDFFWQFFEFVFGQAKSQKLQKFRWDSTENWKWVLVYKTAWKVSVFWVSLVRIFQHSDWIRTDTKYFSVFSPNAGKYGRVTPNTDFFHAV